MATIFMPWKKIEINQSLVDNGQRQKQSYWATVYAILLCGEYPMHLIGWMPLTCKIYKIDGLKRSVCGSKRERFLKKKKVRK